MKRIVLSLLVILCTREVFAVSSVKITALENQNPILSGYTELSVRKLESTFRDIGIVLPGNSLENEKPDLIVTVSLFISEGTYNALMEISSFNRDFNDVNGKIRIKTHFIENIPLLASREIIRLHQKLPVIFDIEKTETAGFYSASIGSSTDDYEYYINKAVKAEITASYPESSLIFSTTELKTGKIILKNNLKIQPMLSEINLKIEQNIYKNIRLNRNMPELYTEHKFIEGLLITNPLSNLFAPGIGSYFSMENLGIEDPEYSYLNICTTFSMTLFQILYVPYKNDFNFDFTGSDYSRNDRYMQTYLLSTIPFTFTVSYLDNLALNCKNRSLLPPFFMQRDSAAATLSLFVPGGGFFYKGHRSLGFLSYSLQFAYGAYYFSNFDETSGNNEYLIIIIAMRLVDIAGAFLISPNYQPFSSQIEKKNTVDLYLGMNGCHTEDITYQAGLTLKF